MPNELALMAFGWRLTKASRISEPVVIGPGEPRRYISHICASADAVAQERDRLIPDGAEHLIDYRYILAVSSVYWGHHDRWRELVQGAEPVARRRLKKIYASVVQASTYYDRITVDGDAKEALRSLRGEITRQRAADMASFTSALSALSSATLAPVPGNLFMGECLMSPVMLPMSMFSEVLVIRSFAPGDVLRNMFENAVDAVQEGEHARRDHHPEVSPQVGRRGPGAEDPEDRQRGAAGQGPDVARGHGGGRHADRGAEFDQERQRRA
jgi:hypothetical protein